MKVVQDTNFKFNYIESISFDMLFFCAYIEKLNYIKPKNNYITMKIRLLLILIF
jgi:hypothetical protein